MGIRLPSVLLTAKQILKMQFVSSRCQSNIPKGHIAVYVGENQRKRFLVPISYLNHPSFVKLLSRAEEEFGFNHPAGGLTIPCKEEAFIDVTSRLVDDA
ncbi:auxin-responsive protein SAUR23-like [Momordica charantia]|uniref:Auxin-responsive protein SAUR23-like n=1 Tax=Momordica charantia TaxID=3673 RepID=A0A6J1CYU1_MOMCH|nr:auxin-responsive protein SAUR23-like [Momordica charantia]